MVPLLATPPVLGQVLAGRLCVLLQATATSISMVRLFIASKEIYLADERTLAVDGIRSVLTPHEVISYSDWIAVAAPT